MTETTQTTPLRLPLRASRSRRWQVLPIIEIIVLVIGALLPLVLKDYLTVYATRVLILCLFALSFDLVWGYAGIMSFGQAVVLRDRGIWRCAARPRSRRDLDPAGVAGRPVDRLAFALLLGGFLLLGPPSVQRDLCFAGHAHRVIRRGSCGAGVVLSWRPNGIPSIPPCRSAVTISPRGRSIII